MAGNAKISDNSVFINTITDITQIDGFAAYATVSGTGNAAMSGTQIVTSLESNLDLSNFTTGKLDISHGGTGASTAQDGINGLTNVATATAGDVLTESGGNAVWQAPSSGGGKFVSSCSFQGWQDVPTGFGSPMATWAPGGGGTGGKADLGFWRVPFECTLEDFSAQWGWNTPFVNGGNNPIIGIYKRTEAQFLATPPDVNTNWGSALKTITIPNTGDDWWIETSIDASIALTAGDIIAVFMDVTPTGTSSADGAIWINLNFTY